MQWLSAVSKYRADITAAPNFAFPLVQRKTSPELRNTYDISSLKVRHSLNVVHPVCERVSEFLVYT
jgi:hypothetical protein